MSDHVKTLPPYKRYVTTHTPDGKASIKNQCPSPAGAFLEPAPSLVRMRRRRSLRGLWQSSYMTLLLSRKMVVYSSVHGKKL